MLTVTRDRGFIFAYNHRKLFFELTVISFSWTSEPIPAPFEPVRGSGTSSNIDAAQAFRDTTGPPVRCNSLPPLRDRPEPNGPPLRTSNNSPNHENNPKKILTFKGHRQVGLERERERGAKEMPHSTSHNRSEVKRSNFFFFKCHDTIPYFMFLLDTGRVLGTEGPFASSPEHEKKNVARNRPAPLPKSSPLGPHEALP